MRKSNHLISRIVIMSASGCLLILLAGRYTTSPQVMTPVIIEAVDPVSPNTGSAKHFVSRVTAGWESVLANISSAVAILKNEDEREEYTPSVLTYNLIHLFPEDSSTEASAANDMNDTDNIGKVTDISKLLEPLLKPLYVKLNLPVSGKVNDSYGWQMYEVLNKKDAEWTSQLYRWIQATPARAAAMAALPASAVTGGYNPADTHHIKEEPNTWLIPSWKNVTVNFYDGDGKRIYLYSNTQDIISVANVSTYYTGWQDIEAFQSYIVKLWDASHSYSAKISAVYYCDGCVDPSADKILQEPADGGLLENNTDILLPDGKTSDKTASEASQGHDESAGSTEAEATGPGMAISDAASPVESAAPPSEDVTLPSEDVTLPSESAAPLPQSTHETKLNAQGKFCPGHVDLTITALIIGLSEKTNLFTVDKNDKAWTPYRMAYADALYAQDWKTKYSLSPMELGIGKPLTSTEISNYLSALTSDISFERRTLVYYALNSVGKIPYYYGGKPYAADYENNHFSSLTKPDQKGRVLSGLDCSGWINWVYWSSIGKRLEAVGTSGLIHEGRAINREELKAGDILVKPGTNSHVVMFLNWSSNGSMICIHETGGAVNNVTVSTLNANWPYCRAILD